jgi:two-component system, cell cycle sensor histidine kinase and response regulator CckA
MAKVSIIRLFKRYFLLMAISFLLLYVVVISVSLTHRYMQESDKITSHYTSHQRDMIQREVARVADRIHLTQETVEEKTKTIVETRCNEAYSVISSIYEQNKSNRSKRQIYDMIRDALRDIRYSNGAGSYLIMQMDRAIVLCPQAPSAEGLDVLDFLGDKIKPSVEKLIGIAQQSGEGFVECDWTKPGCEGVDHKRISYLKYFEPYDFVVTTGLYVEDVQEQIQAELLLEISNYRFGAEGYIFANRMNGDALVANGEILSGKDKLWEVFNKNPDKTKALFDLEHEAALKPDGDYIYYSFQKLSDSTVMSKKVSFIYGIPEWGWLIGAGVYVDDVEDEIALLQSEIKHDFFNSSVTVILLTLMVIAVFLLLLRKASRRLQSDIAQFVDSFQQAADENRAIEHEPIVFKEIELLAEKTNQILQDKMTAQRHMQEDRERLAVTLRSIGDGVITTDTAGNILLINTITEELTGWDPKDAVGKPIQTVFKVVDEVTNEPRESLTDKVLATGEVIEMMNHTALIGKDGSRFIIEESAAPIMDDENKTIGVVLVFRDVTEKRRTSEELMKVKKLESVGVLAGGIAHDFNNILAGILGNIELAEFNLEPTSPVLPLLAEAKKASIRAKDLTQQLLTFAKGGDPVKQITSIDKIITDSADFVLHGSPTICNYDFPDGLWKVDADPGQISQVIQNIVINARHAMPDGGVIDISCENVHGTGDDSISRSALKFVKIVIKDSGTGIPDKYISKIFDPYFTTKQAGSGLGLAICHSIILKHDGSISVESDHREGTTFSIYLPASMALPESSVPDQVTNVGAESKATIMIMDDEVMIRDIVSRMLSLQSHDVVQAADGHEAIAIYNEYRKTGRTIDIIIMDLTIPGSLGGRETVQEILKIDADAKVIVASGYANDPAMAHCQEYGFTAAIAKPFQLADLVRIVNSVLQ